VSKNVRESERGAWIGSGFSGHLELSSLRDTFPCAAAAGRRLAMSNIIIIIVMFSLARSTCVYFCFQAVRVCARTDLSSQIERQILEKCASGRSFMVHLEQEEAARSQNLK
jgi:hypothetical protein